jgi:deoxyribodipyrimidine photolyase-related protein
MKGFLILGNQLFPLTYLKKFTGIPIFMAEDMGLCTHFRYHRQKITLFLSAMRSYRDDLIQKGFQVDYHPLFQGPDSKVDFLDKLGVWITKRAIRELIAFEIEDKFFEKRIVDFAKARGLLLNVLPSPMFMTSRQQFVDYLRGVKKPFMKTFYESQRKRTGILMERNGEPAGGKWSFDNENRKKLPKTFRVPEISLEQPTQHTLELAPLVDRTFNDHPGSASQSWLPTTRKRATKWMEAFFKERFVYFGEYEDALSNSTPFLFHSVLTPILNLGLVTPKEVLDAALDAAQEHAVPINSLEGFVRQILGWREFIRGIYQNFSEKQEVTNHFKHSAKLNRHWYTGTTGLPPLDDAINKATRWGYNHHIERLMVISNLMLLCGVHPHEAHRWFMEMYVDSSDWVMGPNVYGMGQMSDGGIFATKPYISGSNYILKMSDYTKGSWCDGWDGLYWQFIERSYDEFIKNPRMATMARSVQRLDPERKSRIFRAADKLRNHVLA